MSDPTARPSPVRALLLSSAPTLSPSSPSCCSAWWIRVSAWFFRCALWRTAIWMSGGGCP